MANLPIRYTSTFKSTVESFSGSVEYTIRILDKDLPGDLNADLYTTDVGFTLEYYSRNDNFEDPIKASTCTVPMLVRNQQDQTLINGIVVNQEQRFFIEILRNGAVYWRGVVLADQITQELRPFPYIINIVASDGLAELSDVKVFGGNSTLGGSRDEFANLVSRFIKALSETAAGEVWADSDPYLETNIRWFEDGMPSTLVDPWAYTRFASKNTLYTVDDETGEEEVTPQSDIFRNILKGWNARIFQQNGKYYITQCNNYTAATLNTFTYSKEYVGGVLPTDAGVLASNTSVPIEVDLSSSFVTTDYLVKEAGAVYDFIGALKSAEISFDYALSNVFFLRNGVDLTTLTNTNQFTIANGTLGLDVSGEQTVVVDDSTFAGALYNLKIDLEITLKIDTFYYNGTAWTTTPATVTVTVNTKFENNVGANLYKVLFSFTTTPIPTQDDLEVKFVTVLSPQTSAATNPFKTQEYTDVEIYYDDPNAGTDVSNSFITTNTLFPKSSVILDLGEVFIGDRDISLQLQNYFLDNNANTKQWAIDAVGSGGAPINLLLTQELVHQRKTPRRKFDLNIYGAYIPLSVILFDSTRFILNGGTFNARDESFEATLIEINRQDGDIISEEQNGQGNPSNPTFKTGSGLQGGINDRMRWAGAYSSLAQGVTLQPNDVTIQDGWLAVATAQTTDAPAPVQEGRPIRFNW